MATVRFTPHLHRFFPLPPEVELEATSLATLVERLDARWPGLGFYLVDEQGRLRENVAVWIDGERLLDPARIADPLRPGAIVHLMQALSGG